MDLLLSFFLALTPHPGKPGKYLNLIIRTEGLECTGISSKVLENTGIRAYFWCDFATMFIFVIPLKGLVKHSNKYISYESIHIL